MTIYNYMSRWQTPWDCVYNIILQYALFLFLGNETTMFFTIHFSGQWIQLIGHSPTPEGNATSQQWRIWSDTTFQSCLAVICSSSYQRIATIQVGNIRPGPDICILLVLSQAALNVLIWNCSFCKRTLLYLPI